MLKLPLKLLVTNLIIGSRDMSIVPQGTSPIGVIMIIRGMTRVDRSHVGENGGSEIIARGLVMEIGPRVQAAARTHLMSTILGTLGNQAGMTTDGDSLILPRNRRRRLRDSGQDSWVRTVPTWRDAGLPTLQMPTQRRILPHGAIGADDT